MADKRKKIHSPIKNLLYNVLRNRYFYFATVLILGATFVLGVYALKDSGTSSGIDDGAGNEITSVAELPDLEIYFLDVGQGDCTLIKFPDGKNMLIDGGKNDEKVKTELDKYLTIDSKKLKIDYCVATHPDEDHIGSLSYVYENYDVGYSFRPYVSCGCEVDVDDGFVPENGAAEVNTSAYVRYLEAVYAERTPYEYFLNGSDFSNSVKSGDKTYTYSVDFVLPYADTVGGFTKFTDSNDYSAVIIIEYCGVKIMFTGDINYDGGSKSTERRIVAAYESNPLYLNCDILKVAHHGSETSTCVEFLNAVKPEYAVISCGIANEYGHPARGLLDRLIADNCLISRTDLQGTVKFSVTKDGVIERKADKNDYDEYLFADGSSVAWLLNGR